MVSPAWTVVTVALLATCGLSRNFRIGDFLVPRSGTTIEEHVSRMREVFLGRVRCRSQQMCQECLSTRRILNMTQDDEQSHHHLQAVARAAVVILNYVLSFHTWCTAESVGQGYVGSCRLYDQCLSELRARLSSPSDSLEALEAILREVKAVFEPDPSKQCFSAEMVLKELKEWKELEDLPGDVAAVLVTTAHLYSGECIDVGESVSDFLDDIFLHYGDGCERVISQSGFTQLWNDLQMQRKGKHIDHGMQIKACDTPPDDAEKYVPSGLTGEVIAFGTTPSHNHLNQVSSRRIVRHTVYPDDHQHKNLANECLPSDDLLQRFLTPGDKVITSSAFLQLCPALVQQAVSGVCSSRVRSQTNDSAEVLQQVSSKNANPWFAVLSVAVMTAASLLGLCLLPVLKKSFYQHINGFFTGLAFGTMSGDVVLHIMPQYLGLHRHDGEEHGTESMVERLFPAHLQRQLVFLLTLLALFLIECLFATFTGEGKHHHHHHGPAGDVPMGDLNVVTHAGEAAEMKPKASRCSRIADFLKPSNLLTGISSKAAVIVLADTVHNFADGMAIAVGFATSYKDGISTSVAVLFHELPHEIGDFAVLMNSGMGFWKAFVFNMLSGVTSFLGLGVGLSTASVFREWLLCVTAGLFFFVVMVELLPDMRLRSKSEWKVFVVKMVGTVVGIGSMICIAMYELYTN